jgi:hypothetical protein
MNPLDPLKGGSNGAGWMTLAQKIRKIFSSDGCLSMAAGMRRLTYPLAREPFIAAIDRAGFEKLREKHYIPGERVLPPRSTSTSTSGWRRA